MEDLDTAKGITPLKAAIEAAESARQVWAMNSECFQTLSPKPYTTDIGRRLPEEIVVVGRERLIRREAGLQSSTSHPWESHGSPPEASCHESFSTYIPPAPF